MTGGGQGTLTAKCLLNEAMCCEVDNKLDATRLDYSEPSCPSREEADDRDTEPTGSHQHLGFQRGMAIASLNINGLRYHHDEIKFLLNDKRIHILALNETKLDGSIPKELTEISGYQQLRLDRTCNGGGVSLYVSDTQGRCAFGETRASLC